MLRFIFEYLHNLKINKYSRCYSEREKTGDAVFMNCSGLVGGTSNTEYLQEQCLDCPYFVMINRKEKNNDIY